MSTLQPPQRASDKGSLIYFGVLCFIAALGGLLFGYDTAVISGANKFLKDQFKLENAPLLRGWIVSSALVGCLVGSAAGGWLSDRYGRKRILILSALLFVATSIGCTLAPEPATLSVARLIGGIGVGIASMVVPLYIAEISPARLRGRMVSCYQFAITIGILVAYFANAALLELSVQAQASEAGPVSGPIGAFYHWIVVDQVWRGMVGTLLIPAGLFFILLFLVPESPRWLVKQGRSALALLILGRIAGKADADRQMLEIQETLSQESEGGGQFFRPGMGRALGIAVFLCCAAQFSGINAIIYYGPDIFEAAGFKISKALGGQVVLGIVNMAFTLLAMWKVDTLGRRPLLIAGNAGVFVSLVIVGILFASNATGGNLLVFFMGTYLACFAFSLGPLPWVIMSEIFPTRIRGRAMSIATLSLWLANTIVCQAFPYLKDAIGPGMVFFIFAALVSPVFWFAWKVLPETKGRSLEELEEFFRR